ncbi:MAG: DUF4760 domain-containing protein [Candidatus Hodarchaeales archaeon]
MKPTKDDAELLLQFMAIGNNNDDYKNAGNWFFEELSEQSYEEFKSKYPVGSQGYRNFMLVIGFNEVISTFVNNNLLSGDLVFDLWGNLNWKKAGPIVKGLRKDMEYPRLFENYEYFVKNYNKWDEKNPKKV